MALRKSNGRRRVDQMQQAERDGYGQGNADWKAIVYTVEAQRQLDKPHSQTMKDQTAANLTAVQRELGKRWVAFEIRSAESEV